MMSGIRKRFSNRAFTLDLTSLQWQVLQERLGTARKNAVILIQFFLEMKKNTYSGLSSNFGSYSVLHTVEEYDLVSSTWSMVDTYGEQPAKRWKSCGEYVEAHDVFVTFGGFGNGKCLNDTYCLSLEHNTQCEPAIKGKPPSARSEHSSCAIRNTVFIFAGENYGQTLRDLYLLKVDSPAKLLYTKLKDSVCAVDNGSLTAVGRSKSLVLGGLRTQLVTRRSLICDFETDLWLSTTHSTSVRGHQTINLGERTLRIGGRNVKSLCEEVSSIF